MNNNMNYEGRPNGPWQGGPSGSGGNGQGGDGTPPKKQSLLFLLIASLITLVCMSYFMKSFDAATTRELPYNEFVTMLEEGKVDSVYMTSDKIEIYPVEEKK